MLREFTCIMCPQGCTVSVELPEDAKGNMPGKNRTEINAAAGNRTETNAAAGNTAETNTVRRESYRISGNRCPRGAEYVIQEIENPMRNIATSILVEGGELPLASVRLTRPVPREKLFAVMEEIKTVKVSAPVREGEIVISDVLGLGSDVMVTKTVEFQQKL